VAHIAPAINSVRTRHFGQNASRRLQNGHSPDVLKVGHHGSAYSSTPAFIAAVHPRYAIVSVGRHNMFGHPAPQTLETLQRFGAKIYRTDENGAITITTDGQGVEIASML
jgi:beta-lactamase superfamily II metal-dependent hydrolase